MARIVFLSDLHLSTRAGQAWPDESCRARLKVFLGQLLKDGGPARGVERIVLLGDIFDTWRCPVDEPPPEYEEIFRAHTESMAFFRALAGDGRLTYVIGNHDFDVPIELVRQTIPGLEIVGPGDKEAFRIRACGLFAQHGHQYSIFNRVSSRRDLLAGFPFGYYITRLRASLQDGGGGFSFGQIQQYLHGLGSTVGGGKGVFHAFLDAVAGSFQSVQLAGRTTIAMARIKSASENLAISGPAETDDRAR
jgi:predicted phosphodiesterase